MHETHTMKPMENKETTARQPSLRCHNPLQNICAQPTRQEHWRKYAILTKAYNPNVTNMLQTKNFTSAEISYAKAMPFRTTLT